MSAVEIFPGNFSPMGLGTIPPEDMARYSGLELLRRIVDGLCPSPPISGLLNFNIVEAEEGRVVFRGMPSDKLLHPLGNVHGGWTATLLDSAMACAVQSVLAPGEAYTTAEFKVNFMRPVTSRTGEVVCEGRIIHRGRTLAVSEGTLKDASGKLLASGTETCSIFPLARLAAR